MTCISRRDIPTMVSSCPTREVKVDRIMPTVLVRHAEVIQIVRDVKPCK